MLIAKVHLALATACFGVALPLTGLAQSMSVPVSVAQTEQDMTGRWRTPDTPRFTTSGVDVSVNDLQLAFAPDGTGKANFGLATTAEIPGLDGGFSVQAGFRWRIGTGGQLVLSQWSGTVRPQRMGFVALLAAEELQRALPGADPIKLRVRRASSDALDVYQAEIDRTYRLERIGL